MVFAYSANAAIGEWGSASYHDVPNSGGEPEGPPFMSLPFIIATSDT